MSRVDSYKERERGEREGSPVPVVELYDTSGAQVRSCHSLLVLYSLFLLCFPFCSLETDDNPGIRDQLTGPQMFLFSTVSDQLLKPTQPPA